MNTNMGNTFPWSSSPSYLSDTQLLYDQQAASQARMHVKSDFTSASALKDHLQPGDLIQKKGDSFEEFFYSHWAVYIGNGEIVHVTKVNGSTAKAKIVREDMVSAFNGKNVRKNNLMDEFWQPRGRREIIQTARNYEGCDWDFNLFSNNCEHFASWCRYGKRISLQSLELIDVIRGEFSYVEYVTYHAKAVKEKWDTFNSWIRRKEACTFPAIGGGSHAAIGYEILKPNICNPTPSVPLQYLSMYTLS